MIARGICCALVCLISTLASSQSKFYRGTLGLSLGTNQYNGDLANDFYRFGTINPFFGLSYSHYLTQRADFRFALAMGSWGYEKTNGQAFDVDVFNSSLDLKIKLLNSDNPRLMPYVFGGMGFNSYSNWMVEDSSGEPVTVNNEGEALDPDELDGVHGLLSAGAGVQIHLADRVFITLEERFLFPATDNADAVRLERSDYMLMHTAAISFGLFPWNDADKDGVGDKEDKCPNTPLIAKVDDAGCPIDTDLDGVADFEDNCVDIPGAFSGKGCPDADGDTFIDAEDACPAIAGLAAFKGCPDTDADGITDAEDECPELKGPANLKGCPDTDLDGISDISDKCPATPSTVKVDAKGCPLDVDHDGIADFEDNCPAIAGTAANKGCPEVKEEVKALFKQALTGIQFETGKDIIKTSSYALLDTVALVMNDNPAYKLRIKGHTDNVGDPIKNLELSDKRAKAVRKYLVDKGVAESRILSATGMGDQNPVADNSTKEGRALNRRVEFEVEF